MRRNSIALAFVASSALIVTAFGGTSSAAPSAGLTAFHQASGVTTAQAPAPLAGKKRCTNNLKATDTGLAVSSQNFETAFDPFDDMGAEDFVCKRKLKAMSVTFLGQYFNGTTGPFGSGGPANSFNITVYQNSILPASTTGEPDDLTPRVVCANANVPYTDNSGSITGPVITFQTSSVPCKIKRGTPYWIEVQANMDFVDPSGQTTGQWGWDVTQASAMNPGDWKNPLGGFSLGPSSLVYEDGTTNTYMCQLVGGGLPCPLDYIFAVS